MHVVSKLQVQRLLRKANACARLPFFNVPYCMHAYGGVLGGGVPFHRRSAHGRRLLALRTADRHRAHYSCAQITRCSKGGRAAQQHLTTMSARWQSLAAQRVLLARLPVRPKRRPSTRWIARRQSLAAAAVLARLPVRPTQGSSRWMKAHAKHQMTRGCCSYNPPCDVRRLSPCALVGLNGTL